MSHFQRSAIVAVTSDLATDQRVHRNCLALMGMGYKVFLVGRRLPNSPDMSGRTYRFKRLQLLFNKGPLFYASFNLRLFFFLMSHRSHLIFANDL
ncbi:MAG: glycosyltransferase, partial [Bacteroidia bacterium]